MARKPNYSFERKERDRIKAEKKARRLAEKQESRENEAADTDPSTEQGEHGSN